jgi:hypothetical protein
VATATAAGETYQRGKQLVLRLERERGEGVEWREIRRWIDEGGEEGLR